MTRALARRHARRRRLFGVTTVEFALVAPVLFAGLFGTIDGGLLMFSANALNNSAGLGLITVAQEGNQTAADTDAITAIRIQGFGASGFAKIDEIDVFKTAVDAVTGMASQDMSLSCPGPLGTSVVCFNRYDINGALLNPLTDGTAPWKTASRQTSLSDLTTAGITIKAHYNYLAFNASRVTLNYTRYFQLEPQSQ